MTIAFDQNVASGRWRWFVSHSFYHFVRIEVVLIYLQSLHVLHFEYELFNYLMRPSKVDPTNGPLRIAFEKFIWIFIGFFNQIFFSSNIHLELVNKQGLFSFGLLLFLFHSTYAWLFDSVLGLVEDFFVTNRSIEINMLLFYVLASDFQLVHKCACV